MAQESRDVSRLAPESASTEEQNSTRILQEVYYKYGRYYGSVKPEKYKFPIDDEEMARYDMFNKVFLIARGRKIFTPDIKKMPQNARVMDLGGGSGIWSIVLSDKYLEDEAVIQSVDLHRVQPPKIPVNVTMTTADIEDPSWDTLLTGCDLIHMRLMLGAIHNYAWPHIYRKAFEHTTPGGFIEQVEIDWLPVLEGPGVPEHFLKWTEDFLNAMDVFQQSARVNSRRVKAMMEAAGYVNFHDETIKCYLNPSTGDKKVDDLAYWFNECVTGGLVARGLMPMIEGLGRTMEDVVTLSERAKAESLILNNRMYCVVHVWTATKPMRMPMPTPANTNANANANANA